MRTLASWLAAGTLALMSSVAAGQVCNFNGTPSSIMFSPLDPSVATTQTAFTTVKVTCFPTNPTVTWTFSGANGSAPLRMKHSTLAQYIPYTISTSLTGTSGFIIYTQTWRVTATVLGTSYQNAYVGSYSDTLTANILP
jgi:hypothetical protein